MWFAHLEVLGMLMCIYKSFHANKIRLLWAAYLEPILVITTTIALCSYRQGSMRPLLRAGEPRYTRLILALIPQIALIMRAVIDAQGDIIEWADPRVVHGRRMAVVDGL